MYKFRKPARKLVKRYHRDIPWCDTVNRLIDWNMPEVTGAEQELRLEAMKQSALGHRKGGKQNVVA